jgi:hypothetical protein
MKETCMLERGLRPYSTQKLARELRFTLNLINGPSPYYPRWDFQHAPSRVAGGHPSQHVQQMGDGGPQPIGSGSDTIKEFLKEIELAEYFDQPSH